MSTIIDPGMLEHIARLRAALFDTYDLRDIARFITERTFLNGDRFSFQDHEFQLDILNDTSQDINVQKCAQVGLSELMARYGIAASAIMPYFSTILTMPFSGDASKFVKTRIDPIIAGSPALREMMDPELDNTEIKGIGTSLFYARGTNGTTSALSVPADMLIHDEIDRSDPATLAQYQSRIKHSRWKLTRKFGTPTMDGVGIALEMTSSRRFHHMVKCSCCNHRFVPNYHDNVHIPGYSNDKKEITKDNLMKLRWQEAAVLCPACGRIPSLLPEHREWVCENPGDALEAKGYYVIPFSVPNIVTPAILVKESTKYKGWTEFCNQALGETNNDDNAQLTANDVEQCKFQGSLDSGETHCMGGDMGLICHLVVGRMTQAGELLIVHRERVALAKVEEAKRRLAMRYRVLTSVFDSQPYTDTILRMQQYDRNIFGGLYHDNNKMATYSITHADPKAREGKLPIHVANIHRDLNFDEVMYLFKNRKLLWASMTASGDDDLFQAHVLDMKRMQHFDRHNEMSYTWQKSGEGQDHYMHATGYLHVACRLAPTMSRTAALGATGVRMKAAGRIRTATLKETADFGGRV